ncbi:phosphoenolpyruvate synthase, partial [Patescibacteria group bacterium]|nr:phosphoenolpyruvate synthase [Patescibacteria group bacterium]
ILKNVKKCWASLYTPRALFYRIERKMRRKSVSVAVVIEKMIQSEVSGICFTVHPITKDKNQMIIEAGYGLGEAIVGGMITPDAYVVEKDSLTILDININEQEKMIKWVKNKNQNIVVPKAKQAKQKLNNSEIIKLSKIVRNIEKHYKSPQDIEWAFAKGKLYITQSRPITTL